MPLKLFWSAVRHIDRIRAAEDLRSLNVALVAAAAGQGDGKSVEELRAGLNEQQGLVMKFREKAAKRRDIMTFLETIK